MLFPRQPFVPPFPAGVNTTADEGDFLLPVSLRIAEMYGLLGLHFISYCGWIFVTRTHTWLRDASRLSSNILCFWYHKIAFEREKPRAYFWPSLIRPLITFRYISFDIYSTFRRHIGFAACHQKDTVPEDA